MEKEFEWPKHLKRTSDDVTYTLICKNTNSKKLALYELGPNAPHLATL